MTPDAHRTARVEFPSDLEVLVTREFDAPIQLVFDVFWKEEHLRKTIAPFGEQVTVCSVDLRVGGDYRYVFVPDGADECSFRGTFLEIDEPRRSVQTWRFDGWPDVEAVESMELHETDGVTTLQWRLTFADQAGRDHMKAYDGIVANMDNVEQLLTSLLAS